MEPEEDRAVEEEVDDGGFEVLKQRFRASAISITESTAKKENMEIDEPIILCISDLVFKYAEQLAKDVEAFAHHGGRRAVTVQDVIISAHRNQHLTVLLKSFAHTLKATATQPQRKRKKKEVA